MDDVIIPSNLPSKYMHEIEIHFKVKYVMESPNYYMVYELARVGYRIYVSSKKYVNEILREYQKTHGDLKKEVIPMRVKEHPEFYDSPLLEDKEHKDFQHIIGLCQWLIVAGVLT